MREGEKKQVEEEEEGAKEERKGQAENKKYDLAKRITKESGGDKGYMKEEECKICHKKHKTSEHHKHKKEQEKGEEKREYPGEKKAKEDKVRIRF